VNYTGGRGIQFKGSGNKKESQKLK